MMFLRAFFLLFLSLLFVHSTFATDYHLYYLGGQSNMDGYGYSKELPTDLNKTFDQVMIFHGNSAPDGDRNGGKGIWSKLRPGHGVGFQSDGTTNTYSDRFGIELSFANYLQQQNPNTPIAIIKYSRGGTSIAIEAARNFGCWDPDFSIGNGINQYDHFLATVEAAMEVNDIDQDGKNDRLIPKGILWMQGESDADVTQKIAFAYEDNLTRLMNLIRAALWEDDLPVVIGRISDSGNDPSGKVWDYGEVVQKAQSDFVEGDACAALVTSTTKYGYSDKWHYDSPGYVDFGKEFAKAVLSLQ